MARWSGAVDTGAGPATPRVEHHQGGPRHGACVLELGGGVGALVVHTTAATLGTEIELSPVGRDRERVHTVVRERIAAGRVLHAGVFPEVPAGEYTLWCGPPGGHVVRVVAGEVAEVDLGV